MITISFTANDISCDHCKSTIEKELGELCSVQHVEVDTGGKIVNIAFDGSEITADELRAKLADIGYPAA